MLSQVLSKDDLNFEDKLIIDNALALWVGCLMQENSLLDIFYTFKDGDMNSDKLVLAGLLFCKTNKIKDLFKSAMTAIA